MLVAMRTCLVLLCAIVLLMSRAAKADAAVPPSFSFGIARAPHPLPIDPSLSDPAWALGKVPVTPWENVTTRRPAAEETEVYVLYDDAYLYVGFVARQADEPIVATQTTDDVGFGTDDFVGIGVDTSAAGEQAYYFEATPRGVHYAQANEDVRYRPSWRSAATYGQGTWRAVMIVPLNAMRLRPVSPQTWRITFVRNVAARGEHLSWSYDPTMQDQPAGSWPAFGDMRFWPSGSGITLRNAGARKARLEVYGLSASGANRLAAQQANGTFLPQPSRPAGLDLSYPLTSTINFVGTANPDFSNAEIDQQTIAPQEFQRKLLEYRPFFAEGAPYVNTNPQGYTNFNAPTNAIFYSPSIGPFDRGAKVEGTYGLQGFGALAFRGFDEVTGDTFDDQAFGFRHALQDRSFQYWTDGVLAHHSVAGSDEAYEAGVRARNFHTGLDVLFNSGVDRGPQGVGHSTYGYVDVLKPNYQAILQYADLSPTYKPFDGFTTINDIRGFAGFVNLNGSTRYIKSWAFFVQGDRFLNHLGAVHEADSNVFLNVAFKNGLSINGLGPSVSLLRSTPSDAPVAFNLMIVPLGYRDGTPRPIDVSANWGSFGGNWLHYYTSSTSRPLGTKLTIGLEYDATYERSLATGLLDSQFLRRISVGFNLSNASTLTLQLRDINGLGGFATQPGLNFAAAYHARLKSGDFYFNFGSPSANVTLDRFIAKYVLRIGADAGT